MNRPSRDPPPGASTSFPGWSGNTPGRASRGAWGSSGSKGGLHSRPAAASISACMSMTTSPLTVFVGVVRPLEDGSALFQLLFDLAGVGGGVIGSDRTVALSPAAAQALSLSAHN